MGINEPSFTLGVEEEYLLVDKETLVVPHDKLDLDGFVVDPQTSRRFPHLRCERPDATASTRALKRLLAVSKSKQCPLIM